MRYLEAYRSEHQDNGLSALQVWLRNAFTKGLMKKNIQRNKNELHKLSHHLLDDLGFTREAQPLSWSSYSPKNPQSANVKIADNRTNDCRHHCHCESAVGCVN